MPINPDLPEVSQYLDRNKGQTQLRGNAKKKQSKDVLLHVGGHGRLLGMNVDGGLCCPLVKGTTWWVPGVNL